jgi:hyperosmotically inducible protein
MSLKQWSLAVPLVSFTFAASTCVAQAPAKDETPPPAVEKPAGERVGGKVDSAVDSIKKGVSSAGEAIRDQWEKARTSVHNMGVAARVYGRLHWDKALYNAKVDVDVQKDGVAVLSGSVGDPMARAKAVELTRDTVGVNKVVDQLTVLTTTTGATPGPGIPAKP